REETSFGRELQWPTAPMTGLEPHGGIHGDGLYDIRPREANKESFTLRFHPIVQRSSISFARSLVLCRSQTSCCPRLRISSNSAWFFASRICLSSLSRVASDTGI